MSTQRFTGESTASLIARKAHAIADDSKRISVIEQQHNTQTVVQEKNNYGDSNDENHRTGTHQPSNTVGEMNPKSENEPNG